ncbi:MAG: amidohydrolase family protein [Planctomycetota bacterium]
MKRSVCHGLPALLACAASIGFAPTSSAEPSGLVAVKAGRVHRVDVNEVLTDAMVIIDGGKIVAVGKDLVVPPAARVVDYGPDAVIVPGFVAADSTYGASGRPGDLPYPRPSDRTADPAVLGIDNFDFYSTYSMALAEGVTSAYISPARGRLIAGQGAVVKLDSKRAPDDERRVLSRSAAIHGAVSAEARNTPGYWRPPIPATVDVGLGVEEAQLPRTLMGAIVALGELVELAKGADDSGTYGPGVGAELRELLQARKPWRMAASTETEIRALVEFFRENDLPLIVDSADEAGVVAAEIARAGASVIVDAQVNPNGATRGFGKERDSRWPTFDTAAKLAAAKVRFAISTPNNVPASELRFAASVASRGGLSPDDALRAITLAPAEILGVSDRVGSLTPGKDADFVVLNGAPLELGTSVIATWVDGDVAYKAYETSAVVVAVDELHLGDGHVLTPGELLMQDGRIVDVGNRVGRPRGATVVRGKAAMPGMIDALGHLGLEGSAKMAGARFELKRLVEPGDLADRRVAQAGVTTVVLTPRAPNRGGAPMMAYKPAATDLGEQIVGDTVALRFQWSDRNRLQAGESLREVLAKAVEYAKKWSEYEKKLASWKPPADASDEPAKEGEATEKDKEAEGEKKDADAEKKGEGDKKDGESKDDADKKKSKKKKGEEEPPQPITGAWETKITVPPFDASRFRLYVLDEEGAIRGSLRCAGLSDDLISISGKRDGRKVTLSGDGTRGSVAIEAETIDGKLKGHVTLAAANIEFEAEHTSTEFEIAGRSELRKPKPEKKKEIKGEPKPPAVDPDLEPLRRAIEGKAAVVVGVDREDEILACVDAFESTGIRPVLYGANDAWKVAARIRGRVAGILLSHTVVAIEPKSGIERRNRFAELAAAGIPVAFHSAAEEGAAELAMIATYAVAQGMSPEAALRALTSVAADMFAIDERVGRLQPGMDADVLLLDGEPLAGATSVTRVWVNGREVR